MSCGCCTWMCSDTFPTGHWWQTQHSSWSRHGDRTRQAGSVECRAVFVWAAGSLALLCWKTLLLTTDSFVNLADFIFVARELCNGCVGTSPKVWAELMLCCLLCSWDWNPGESGVCNGYGGCVAENILEISTSSLVVPLVNVPWGKSEMHWGPCLWGVGLDLVSIDGMRAAEEKQGDWTHQDKGNTPDEDFGLAEKWPPVSEAVNCLVVGDHLKSQSSVVLLLDRDIPKLSHFAGWKCTRTLNWFTSVDPLVFWSWRMVTLAEVVPAVVGSWEITMVLGRTSSVHGNCAFPWGWFKFGSY